MSSGAIPLTAGATVPGPEPTRAARLEALAALDAAGWPTRRREHWRYTDLEPLAAAGFELTPSADRSHARRRPPRAHDPAYGEPARQLVLLYGRRVRGLGAATIPDVDVMDPEERWSDFVRLFAQRISAAQHPLAALNTAFGRHGLWLRLPAGVAVSEPVHLVIVGSRPRLAAQPRILLDAEPGAQATIVQHFIDCDSDTQGWTNCVTQLKQAEGSRIALYRLQRQGSGAVHTSLLTAELAAGAELTAGYFDFGARLVRNDIAVTLSGPAARTDLYGLLLAGAGQHVDDHTLIRHAAGATISSENFRGIIGEHGRGVFNGKVVVEPGCQKIDARQRNDNLLGEHAEIDTKPELEIYAHDVKCSHGSTVGLSRRRATIRSACTRARPGYGPPFADDGVRDVRRRANRGRAPTCACAGTRHGPSRDLDGVMIVATAEHSATRLQRDFAALRKDFPALRQLVHGKPLAYLDNAASSQSPTAVHEAMALQQRLNHSNIHRGVHQLSERSTAAYEGARQKVRHFINAAAAAEIVFTRGTTESIKLGRRELRPAPASGRRSAHHVARASFEHRALAAPVRAYGRAARRQPHPRRRLPRRCGFRAAAQRADKNRCPGPRLERARHAESRSGVRGEGSSRRRRAASRRRCAGRAAFARRRAGFGLRLLRLFGPQNVRADGDRRSLRQASASRGDAAVSRRRRHDSHGQLRAQHLQRRTLQIRSRYTEYHRRRGTRRGGGLFGGHRFRGSARARARAARARNATRADRSPASAHRRHGR